MWRSRCSHLLRQRASSEVRFINNYNLKNNGFSIRPTIVAASFISSPFSTSSSSSSSGDKVKGNDASNNTTTTISCSEARKLMRLVDVEALKIKLLGGTDQEGGREVITYTHFLEVCQGFGVAKSPHEAAIFARVLDDAGVVLLFRDKVFLHPHKVVDLVRRAMPVALLPNDDDDPRLDELKKLQEKKDELDTMAHKQVRHILWSGLGFSLLQVGLFFRLTFWEFSWDVMEPITFFTTTTGVIIGYAYFLFTSRDPSYQDMMKRLFLRRQKKLIKKHSFDIGRFTELQRQCKSSLDAPGNAKHRMVGGVKLETQHLFHR